MELGSPDVKSLFAIGPGNRSINFGSYGCPPKAMNARRQEYVNDIDADTDLFFRVTAPGKLKQVRQTVASFIGWDYASSDGGESSEDLLLVDNAAYAYNVVAQSILHHPAVLSDMASTKAAAGEPPTPRMLSLDRQYPMCRAANTFWNDRYAAFPGLQLSVHELNVDALLLGSDSRVVETAIVDFVVKQFIDGNYDVLLIDHVCWSPAFVFPIVDICRRIRGSLCPKRAESVVIVIDGAHAVGNINLQPIFEAQSAFKQCHGGRPLFDAYFSNFHKWLATPRHAAFLYVDRKWQHLVHPCILSNFFVSRSPTARPFDGTTSLKEVQSDMQREFFWTGTRDLSNFLVIPDVIAFRNDILGGEARIRHYCHNLAIAAAMEIASIWQSAVLLRPHDPQVATSSLSNVWCPHGCTFQEADRVVDRMLRTKHSYGAIMSLAGKPYLRISAQVYNSIKDYRHFAHLFLEMLAEDRKRFQSLPMSKL